MAILQHIHTAPAYCAYIHTYLRTYVRTIKSHGSVVPGLRPSGECKPRPGEKKIRPRVLWKKKKRSDGRSSPWCLPIVVTLTFACYPASLLVCMLGKYVLGK